MQLQKKEVTTMTEATRRRRLEEIWRRDNPRRRGKRTVKGEQQRRARQQSCRWRKKRQKHGREAREGCDK